MCGGYKNGRGGKGCGTTPNGIEVGGNECIGGTEDLASEDARFSTLKDCFPGGDSPGDPLNMVSEQGLLLGSMHLKGLLICAKPASKASFSGLVILNRFRRRRKEPFSNMFMADGCMVQ